MASTSGNVVHCGCFADGANNGIVEIFTDPFPPFVAARTTGCLLVNKKTMRSPGYQRNQLEICYGMNNSPIVRLCARIPSTKPSLNRGLQNSQTIKFTLRGDARRTHMYDEHEHSRGVGPVVIHGESSWRQQQCTTPLTQRPNPKAI